VDLSNLRKLNSHFIEKSNSLYHEVHKSKQYDLGVDGEMIMDWILGNRVEKYGLDASGSGAGAVAGSCEHGNEPSGSTERGKFCD
jgi:hypothetical protein